MWLVFLFRYFLKYALYALTYIASFLGCGSLTFLSSFWSWRQPSIYREGDGRWGLRHDAQINTLCCYVPTGLNRLLNCQLSIRKRSTGRKFSEEIQRTLKMASKADMTPEEREAKEQEEFSTGPLRWVLVPGLPFSQSILSSAAVSEHLFQGFDRFREEQHPGAHQLQVRLPCL